MESIQAFKREITSQLFSHQYSNYCDYKAYVIDALTAHTEILPEHKDAIIRQVRFLEQQFHDTPCNYAHMRHIAQAAGEEILHNLHATHQTYALEKTVITPNIRDNVQQKFGIKKLHNTTVAYRGGVARVIAREILGIPHRVQDIEHTLQDVDLWAKTGTDHAFLMQYYAADSEGINYTTSFSGAHIPQLIGQCDITLNQILVTHDAIYLTTEAKKALETGIVSPLPIGKNFFGRQSYHLHGHTIFHPRQLLRAVKFLIEAKVDGATVPQHNIQKHNLEKMHIEIHILVFVRRIYQKYHHTQRTTLLLSFSHILQQWGIIPDYLDFFSYISHHIQQKNFIMASKKTDLAKDADWKLSKYIDIALDNISQDGASPPDKFHDYDFSLSGDVVIQAPETHNIPPSFIDQQHLFEKTHQLT